MTKQIAIIQYGYAIFGIGNTLQEAIADAKEWMDDEYDDDYDDDGYPRDGVGPPRPDWDDLPSYFGCVADGQMCWAYVTQGLADKVRKSGGDTTWRLYEHNTLCLPSEE